MNPAENWHTVTEPPAPTIAATIIATTTAGMTAGMTPAPIGRKNPNLAALLALFPGVGHIYNGLYTRGITFFLIAFSLVGIADRGPDVFGFAAAFFWLFNVIDAYRQATLINYGYAQDLGLTDLPRHPRASQGGVVAGVLLALIGAVAIGERYFDLDVERLFEVWPFALVAIGGWLIWSSIRDRLRASGGQ